jgi:hypothetical protein
LLQTRVEAQIEEALREAGGNRIKMERERHISYALRQLNTAAGHPVNQHL